MATRRSKKTKEFESLPTQVPLSIDTFAAIVDAGKVMEESVKYLDDPYCVRKLSSSPIPSSSTLKWD